jgi:hypothetical protein
MAAEHGVSDSQETRFPRARGRGDGDDDDDGGGGGEMLRDFWD